MARITAKIDKNDFQLALLLLESYLNMLVLCGNDVIGFLNIIESKAKESEPLSEEVTECIS
jgi:hypothetical protein